MPSHLNFLYNKPATLLDYEAKPNKLQNIMKKPIPTIAISAILLGILYFILSGIHVAVAQQADSATINVNAGADFHQSVIGNTFTFGTFAGLMFIGFLGALVKLLLHAKKGADKINNGTPTAFSWGFMFADNWKRLLLGFLLMFGFVRFYAYILPLVPEQFNVLKSFPPEVVCVVFGFFIDWAAQWLKSKSALLQVSRN
jgi:hypothetical protein